MWHWLLMSELVMPLQPERGPLLRKAVGRLQVRGRWLGLRLDVFDRFLLRLFEQWDLLPAWALMDFCLFLWGDGI